MKWISMMKSAVQTITRTGRQATKKSSHKAAPKTRKQNTSTPPTKTKSNAVKQDARKQMEEQGIGKYPYENVTSHDIRKEGGPDIGKQGNGNSSYDPPHERDATGLQGKGKDRGPSL